jgi:hypothetical protein
MPPLCIMAPGLPPPPKLPLYHPPMITQNSTPSPPPPLGTAVNALVAPLGCELIEHDIVPLNGQTLTNLLKEIVNGISSADPTLAVLPIKVESSRNKDSLSFCYICLSDTVSCMDPVPHPDLLWLWVEAICTAKLDLNVGWSPQPQKDKRLWVRIVSATYHHDAR